jgi:hypothetical protein
MDSNQYLIIGGSTKCGTTSVFNYFEFHPEVCPCKMKESRFFWAGDYPLSGAVRDDQHLKNFGQLFDNCEPEKILLEATPDYLYSPGSAVKIREALPKVKFVFILREPVSRLISWYRFSKANGLIPNNMTFEDYVNLQRETSIPERPQHLRALEQGNYASYLESYIRLFDKQHIYIGWYEQLVSDPGNFCRQIARFAGIEESYFKNFEFKIFNRTVPAMHVGAHQYFRKFKRMIRPATRMFHPAIRKKIKLAAHHLETTYQAANRDNTENKVVISQELKHFLEKYYHDDRLQLEKLVHNKYW